MNGIEQFVKRHILLFMLFIQILWLLGIWVMGASAHPEKLLPLLIFSIVVTLPIILLPPQLFSWLSPLQEALEKKERWVLIGLGTAVFVVGAYYANIQRIWAWDEENSFLAAKIVAQEGVAALLRGYSELTWLGAQHPPLMMLLYGYQMRLFGESLFVMRLVAVLMGVGVTLLTYQIGRELFDRITGFVAALFLLSFPLIIRQTAAAMTDIPVTFFFCLALWLILRLVKRPSFFQAFIVAGVIGVGVLAKYTMVFIYPVLLSYFIVLPSYRKQTRYLAVLILIPALFLLVWGGLAYKFGILGAQIDTLTTYASLILTNQLARQFALEAFLTRLPSALGSYNIPLIALGVITLLRDRQQSDQLLLLWIGVVWLLLALTLPDHRYFMLTFPAIAILIARMYKRIPIERVIIMAGLLGGGALYLFVDWFRVSRVFLP